MKNNLFNITVPLNKLKINPKNLRTDYEKDINKLALSLEKLGQLHNLIITEDYIVLSGNRRLIAMKYLKWKSARCDIYKNLDEHIKGSINIASNILNKKINVWNHREKIAYYFWESFINQYKKKNMKDKGYAEFGILLGLNYRSIKRIIESTDYTSNKWILKFKKLNIPIGVIDAIIDSNIDNRNEIIKRIKNEVINKSYKLNITEIREKIREINREIESEKKEYVSDILFNKLYIRIKKSLNQLTNIIINTFDDYQRLKIIELLENKIHEVKKNVPNTKTTI